MKKSLMLRFLVLLSLGVSILEGASASWNSNVNGFWNDNANWLPASFPNGVADVATLGTFITNPVLVTLNQPITLDSLVSEGEFFYRVGDAGHDLTLTGSSGTALSLQNLWVDCRVFISAGDIIFTPPSGTSTGLLAGALLSLPNTPTVFNIGDNVVQNPDLQVNSVITGTGGVIKRGIGTLQFTGANTYTGGTTLEAGTLTISSDSNLGNSNESITFNGGMLYGAGIFTLPSTRSILLSGAGIIGNHVASTMTIDSVISGAGSLTFQGPGPVILNGANTYAGGTFLTGGVLQINANERLGIGSLTINGGALNTTATFTLSRPTTLVGTARILTDSGTTLTHVGNIDGSGMLQKEYNGTLILEGTNSYTGGTRVSQGTLQGTTSSIKGNIINDTTVIFDQTIDGVYPNVMSGAGNLSKNGSGTITFSGNSAGFTGPTALNQGSFIVNGDMSGSPFTINPSTLLGGIGAVGATVNNGQISPGNSIGTLTVIGDYTQDAAASLLVEIDDMEHSDLLIVTGTANLDGSVVVSPLPGLYFAGKTYTILQANTINGQFAQLIENHPAEFSFSYLAQSVLLNITKSQFAILPIPLSTLKGNAKAIGNYLFECDPNFSLPLVPIIDNLLHQKPEEFIQTLLQFGPQDFGATELTQMQTATMVSHSMNQASDWRACATYDSTFWIEPLGYYYKHNEKEGLAPFQSSTYGVTAGYKKRLLDHFFVSSGIGYSYANLNWYENRGDAALQSIYLSPGISYQDEQSFAGLIVQGSRSFYSADRKIQSKVIQACYIPCINEVAHNNHKSWDVLVGFQGGYKLRMPDHFLKNFFIVPSLNIDYLNIFEEGYREKGAGPINLSVKNKHSAFFRSEFLLRFTKELTIGPFRSFPNLYVGYLKNVSLTNGNFTSRLYKQDLCGSHFTVKGNHQNTSQLILGADLETICFHHLSLQIGYEANIGDHYNIQKGHLKGQWNF